MSRPPWNIGMGIVAATTWSAMVGLPVILFHLRSEGLGVGDHIHAAVLFVISNGLVFWMVALPRQPRTSRKAAGQSNTPPPLAFVPLGVRHSSPATPFAEDAEILDAELVPLDEQRTGGPADSNHHALRLVVQNYFGSSRHRRVLIEPAGANHTLQPGKELGIVARGESALPQVRIVESDHATQIFLEGAVGRIEVTAPRP